ncbi:DUF4440 domain-containing protein [Roseomonas sp. OT10]|uniref:DUF4440 domain-containing protein n=1 Tax=Roseomonas cutis TaxID=2897332 RepID=UPI001E5516AE|nr:DUF4440 domain-containing protein [Roseomonas sp. OT10]UFN50553.1 DUF4440 domain-containing protein [Roseomonas sp. OT10]
MEDERVWSFEESLWTGDAAHYRECIDPECLMVLPMPPYVMSGEQSVAAVSGTPRWARAALTERQVARPQEGLIVVAYKARAERDGVPPYEAHCTSTYRRLAHEAWRVVQHQQTPPLKAGG